MSVTTKISWTDSTVNPVMGCGGCELFLGPEVVCRHLDRAIRKESAGWKQGTAKRLITKLCKDAYNKIRKPQACHSPELSSTNIWHVREPFLEIVKRDHGKGAGSAARLVMEHDLSCYAARLHFNRGASIVNPDRSINPGHASIFTDVTLYPGRMTKAARYPDLLGQARPDSPWLDGLPRLIFVSDMGDCLSGYDADRRAFLESEVMDAVTSDTGQRHFWLWLTKRPHEMARFASHIGGFPGNVCAMTTMLDGSKASFKRLKDLKRVEAPVRGLSIEPLLGPVDPHELDLDGIDWVIVGGESGNDAARAFDLQWARDIRDACRKAGAAFFMKQLGRKPLVNGEPLVLGKDKCHGGDWTEWPGDLRIREMPSAFREYRKVTAGAVERVAVTKGEPLSRQDRARFKELNRTVRTASRSVVDAAIALAEIKRDRLYREQHGTFDAYCREILNFSRQYAYQLIKSGNTAIEMSSMLDAHGLPDIPRKESHLQAFARIRDPEKRVGVYAELVQEVGPDAITAELITDRARALQPDTKRGRPPTPSQRLRDARGLIADLRSAYQAGGDIEALLDDLQRAPIIGRIADSACRITLWVFCGCVCGCFTA